MAMAKYRKRPVVIEAYQTDEEVTIHTLEGTMRASPGDFIITGVNGEKYPCKPDIFIKTYEPVEEQLSQKFKIQGGKNYEKDSLSHPHHVACAAYGSHAGDGGRTCRNR
jgi:hypothetical protein